MPAPDDQYDKWIWEQGLRVLLDGDKDDAQTPANREKFTGGSNRWLEVVEIQTNKLGYGPPSYHQATTSGSSTCPRPRRTPRPATGPTRAQ